MMKWYEQRYVSHRDWILDNMESLGLDINEAMLVLLIDFFNEHNIEITLEDLCKKTNKTKDEMDQIISNLTAKKYLDIYSAGSMVKWSLNGLFEADRPNSVKVVDRDLFDTFESEFGRPLTEREMVKLNEWAKTTDKTMIIYALREASLYQVLSMPYIDKVLSSWKKKGYTGKTIEKVWNND